MGSFSWTITSLLRRYLWKLDTVFVRRKTTRQILSQEHKTGGFFSPSPKKIIQITFHKTTNVCILISYEFQVCPNAGAGETQAQAISGAGASMHTRSPRLYVSRALSYKPRSFFVFACIFFTINFFLSKKSAIFEP